MEGRRFYLEALPIPFAFIFQVRKAIRKSMWREVLQPLRNSTQGPVSPVGVQTPVVHSGDLGAVALVTTMRFPGTSVHPARGA